MSRWIMRLILVLFFLVPAACGASPVAPSTAQIVDQIALDADATVNAALASAPSPVMSATLAPEIASELKPTIAPTDIPIAIPTIAVPTADPTQARDTSAPIPADTPAPTSTSSPTGIPSPSPTATPDLSAAATEQARMLATDIAATIQAKTALGHQMETAVAATLTAQAPTITPTPVDTVTPTPTATERPPARPSTTPTLRPPVTAARLAYAYGDVRDSDIHLYDPATGADWAVADRSCDEAEPGWAPGGQVVVYQSNCSGNYELYAVDVDRGGQRQLTTTTCDDREADVSPDGSQLAYRINCATKAYNVDGEIWIMNLDSGDSYTLGINGRAPAWSPSGNQLTFMSDRGGGWEIFVYDFGSSSERQMTNCSENCRFPGWSPDGHWLFYHATTGPTTTDADTVWKMPASGGTPTVLVTGSNAGRASWSSNGLLAFNSQRGIEVVDVNGSGRRVLLADTNHWAPAWSQ